VSDAVSLIAYHSGVAVDDSIRICLQEARQIRVRYGRAFLTVTRFGGLSGGELKRCLSAYEDGETDAETLCWAFVRERVIDHTPSFDWEVVELPLLLDRIAGASTSPAFPSSDIEDVAATLVETAREEREATERSRKRSLGLMSQNAIQLNLPKKMMETLGGLTSLERISVPGFLERPLKGRSFQLVAPDVARQFSFGSQIRERLAETLGRTNLTLAASPAMRDLRRQILATDLMPFTGVGGLGLDTKSFRIGLRAALNIDHSGYKFAALPNFSKALDGYRPLLMDQLVGKGNFLQGIADASRRWIEAFKRALPINWRELDGGEVDAVVKLMLDTGISLAWAPRTSIIRELLAAETRQEHREILETRSADILADIEEALERIPSAGLLSSITACKESIATYRDGHPDPALAYASTILSHLVHDYFEEKNFGGIRKTFADVDPLNDVGHADFPLFTVGRIWVRAFERFENSEDDAYNRNRTLHILGDHYCEANLLAALMLVIGLLCELQRLEDREVPNDEVEDSASAAVAA
jgi:hypothetical protein